MALIIPGVGTEPGPEYAQDVNNSLTIIDAHSHVAGSGVLITPAAININSNLPMNDNSLTGAASIGYTVQTSTPPNLNQYAFGVDLYFVDGNGNVIQITKGGAINATTSGISSGTASASFIGGVLVVDSAALTPANIQAGSILLGNNVANSNFLTLQPPNAMAASYSLTLPVIPAQTNVMTLDTSGNMGSITYDMVGQSMTVTGADAIAASIDTTGANTILGSATNANIPGSANKSGTLPIAVGTPNTPGGVGTLILAASFNASGTRLSGNGMSIVSFSAGSAVVSFDTVIFGSIPSVVACAAYGSGAFTSVISVSTGSCTIGTGGSNQAFSVIAVGART
jgi:hypothetical protein